MQPLAWLTSSRDGDTSPCAVSLLWDALQIQASQNHVGSQDLGTRCFRSRLSWLPAAKIPQNTPCTREMSSCDLCRGAKGKSEEGSAVLHGASSVPRAWCTPWDHPVLRWLFQQPSCCLDSPGTAETSPGPIPKSLSLSPTRDAAATSPPPERSADLSQHHALHRGAPFGPKGDPGEQLAPSAPANHPPAVLGQDFTPSSRAGGARPRRRAPRIPRLPFGPLLKGPVFILQNSLFA